MVARGTWRCIGAIIGILIILFILGLLFIYSGLFNVAATYPDIAPVEWLLSTTSDHSVKRHAAGIAVPKLDNPAMIKAGFNNYNRMCVFCHGAPGVETGGLGKGLNPPPPELTDAVKDWQPNELFWITKNGVRMTGMPAWGVTTADQDIWNIVAFMEKLPGMTPEQYQAMRAASKPGGAEVTGKK